MVLPVQVAAAPIGAVVDRVRINPGEELDSCLHRDRLLHTGATFKHLQGKATGMASDPLRRQVGRSAPVARFVGRCDELLAKDRLVGLIEVLGQLARKPQTGRRGSFAMARNAILLSRRCIAL